ncbi:autotransporter domain-containing protein [Dyella monticola]|uniref:Autotransporter domain-containing protein n=1 Tax=Dyella monticola TaxID=1927958 RepID=A0A370WZU3_9GAMM|nr:autotransporter domain-containing protein [Dyella monticola]RDS81684.1 autotransporter domain-containing protein [Dyella monticola]
MRPWQAVFARLHAAVREKGSWLRIVLVLGMLAAMPGVARATCTTESFTAVSGATSPLNVGPCTDGIGIDGIVSGPSHGTLDTSDPVVLEYTNDGKGATSDSFVFLDDNNNQVTALITIVAAASITLSPTSAPSGTLGQSYSLQFAASGGVGSPYTYGITQGVLPAGLSDNSSGLISGTPTESGSFTITETATDSANNTGSVTVTIVIGGSSIVVTPASGNLPNATAYQAYSQTMSASGGTAPYTYAQVPGTAPPAGISIGSGGSISGTATALGTTNFSVKVTDNTGTSTQVSYSLQVVAPTITVSPSSLPSGIQNNAYSAQTLLASGGSSPYTFAVASGALPNGMTLSSAGQLSGTPTVTGNFNFTAQATDAHGFTGTQNYTLVINALTVPGAPTIGTATAGDAQATVTFTAPANNGGATITGYTVTSSPGGITGTCAASPCTVTGLTDGTAYTFTATATNSVGTSAPSAASNSVTPKANQTITFTNPNTQNFGTTPTLSATASSGLAVTFSSTTAPVCTITPAGQLTFITAGTCAINADQTGNGTYAPAPTVSQSFAVAAVVPGAPTIGTATAGTTQASVSFTAPAFTGGVSITSYTATSSPGNLTGTCASSPCVVTGLTNGTAYTFTVTATNSAGTGAPSAASNSVTPAAPQTITFNNPGTQNFGTTPTLTATASSGLAVSFNSSTASVCTITNVGALTTVSSGTCTINANQGGDSAYLPAPQVSQSFTVAAVVPGAPVIGTATAGAAQASVSFVPPAFTGGTSITSYIATSSPGGLTGTCASSPCIVTGLTNGTAYTFTVTATNAVGTGAPSAASNSVTPKSSQTITFNNPGTQNFGTSPTLTATASSGLPVTFASSTASVCTITNNGILTTVSPGSCTINANQGGNGAYSAAPQVSQTFAIGGVAPGAPTIGTATAGDTQATVAFTPPTFNGGNAITGYTATSNPGGITGTCANSPCTVTGLTDGTAYTFTVTATNAAGTSVASSASNSVTPKAAGAITHFAANPAQPMFKPSGTFTVSATGDGSSSPVVFAIASSSNSVCSIQGTTVTTLSAGTCNVTANQAGDASHFAAPQVTLAVTITNPPPPVVTNVSANTHYNTATAINLSSAITGIDVTSVAIAKMPAHGTATISGESITYTPSPTFYGGTDSITYTATNPGGTSSPATITVTVTSLAVPVVEAHTVTTTAGTAVVVQAETGATGPQPFTGVSVSAQPAHGSATAGGTQITYTPAAGFVGTDTFTYAVSNNFGSSQPATITVTVTAAGSASGHTKTVLTKPGTPVSVDLASIVPGSYVSSTLLGLSPGNAGNVSLGQPTELTFTSAGNFLGLVQITAVLTSSSGAPVTVDVLVLVTNQPDPSKNADALGIINAQTTEAEMFAQSQLDNIRGRLESLHDGGGSLFSNTLSLSMDGQPMHASGPNATTPNAPWNGSIMRPGIGASDAVSDGTAQPTTSNARQTTPLQGPQGLGIWIGGAANFGSFDAYRQAAGFDSDNMAITTGVDQRLGERGLVGLSVGYNHDNTDIANDGTHSIAQGYSAAVYGSFEPSARTYIDGVLGGGGLNFSSRRYDDDTGDYLLGRRNGDQWFASLTGGYEYKWNNWLLSPYGRLEWSMARLNSFSETGDVTGALTYGDETVRTSQTILGIRASGQVQESFGTLVPHIRFEFGHDFQGASSTTLSYAFIPSAGSWNVLTNPYSANGNSLELGFGTDLQLQRNWLITTEYDYLAQPHSHDQMIRVGVKKKF